VPVARQCFSKHDERGIPGEIVLLFTNGEEVTYFQSDQGISNPKMKLASFTKPELDVSDEKFYGKTLDFAYLKTNFVLKLRTLEDKYVSSVNEAEDIYLKKKAEIEEYAKRRIDENEQLYNSFTKEISTSWKGIKKNIDREVRKLGHPEERLKRISSLLQESGTKEFMQAAQMLDQETEYILKTLEVSGTKWDCFMSHVQKHSADVCGRIGVSLKKKGFSAWIDKEAERLDKHGMVDGVINSRVFVLLLTTDFFSRSYCIFEFCVALVADKSIITVAEVDTRYGGASIGCFKFHNLFKHVLHHEVIEIHRTYWNAFTDKLYERIKSTINSKTMDKVEEVGQWNSDKITNFNIHADKMTLTSWNRDASTATAIGTKELRQGKHRFAVEIIKLSRPAIIHVGVVPVNYKVSRGKSIDSTSDTSSWAYSSDGYKSCGNLRVEGKRGYGTGDIITVEIDFTKAIITYFKNGESLGVALTNVKSPVYPAVSITNKWLYCSVRLMAAKNKY